MVEATINYLAVLVAAIINMGIGFLWYGPLFGKVWMQLSGFTKKQIAEAKKKKMGKTYAIAFLSTLLMSYVMAHFVDYAEANTFALGAVAGFWIWLGFVATIMLGTVLWEGKPIKLYLINSLHYLVALILMGGVLAVWV